MKTKYTHEIVSTDQGFVCRRLYNYVNLPAKDLWVFESLMDAQLFCDELNLNEISMMKAYG